MNTVKTTVRIDEELIKMIKQKVALDSLDGMNSVIEKALKLYFANCSTTVWEAENPKGWVKKLVIRPSCIVVENIRSRKTFTNYDKSYYSNHSELQKEGWKKVWNIGDNSSNASSNSETAVFKTFEQ